MKSLLIYLVLAVAVTAAVDVFKPDSSLDDHWKNYKKQFNKTYGTDHEPKRRKHFEDNFKAIKKHNDEAATKNHTYLMGANHFTDWTPEELEALTGYKPLPRNQTKENFPVEVSETRQLPASVDWRGHRCIGAIRDQGKCAACYAFAAISALEFPLCLKRGSYAALSEQQLIDCSGQQGCTAGRYEASWDYIYRANGAIYRSVYPYAIAQGTCRYWSGYLNERPAGWYYLNGESGMATALANYGPIAVGFHAVSTLFSYKTGIYSDATCNKSCTTANHAFTLVGYGTLNGIPYWIMRNSWGSLWGESGYGKIRRGVNMCNIACWPARVYA